MSSLLIPKEQQSAYERWELSSINEHSQQIIHNVQENKNSALSEKIAQITESARQEGYSKGIKQGYAEGHLQARQEHSNLQQAMTHMAQTMQEALEINQEHITQDLLTLALDIAKSMLKSSLDINRQIVIPVVKDAMQSLSYIQKPAKIIVNPDDAAIIKQELAQEINGTWLIVESKEIERGGCRIETGANQLDATNATRWKRINEALGQNTDWISISETIK